MAWYGRRVTSGDTDLGQVAAGTARATVYDPMPQNGWGHRIAFWGGGYIGEGNPQVRLAAYAVDGSPAHRLGYTGTINVTAKQSYGGDGAAYGANVTNADTSPASNAIKMYAGNRYAIAVNPTGADGQFAMAAAHRISASNENLYTRTGVSFPPNPFNHSSASIEGHISAWMEYQPNRTPTAATSSPSGLITTDDPDFVGTFDDDDDIYGDRMTRYRIQVTRVSDGVLMWDSGTVTASAGEQSANEFTRNYGGSTLLAGVEYRWRCQVADEFSTWSAWTGYTTFTVNGGGIVTPTGFSGKQNTQQPTPFAATWGHANSLSMNAVQVRIKQGNTIIRTGSIVSKSVSVGGSISTTWAEQFGSFALGWGTNYTYEIRGRDSSNLWSNWSEGVSFSTNNPPDVPYNLTPTQSTASSSRPLLRAVANDADSSDLVFVIARIKNAAGTVLQTRLMTALGDGVHEYQTTSTDLPSYATYKWDAYSFDGYLYSGATSVEANATKSSEAAFIYAEGPIVTITNPSTTVTTSSINVTWTATDQQKYAVALRHNDELVYYSGTVTSGTKSHVIPSGYIHEGETYDLQVLVTNSAPLTGTSEVLTFTVDYPTPDAITNFTASPEYQQFDMAPSSVRLTWDESSDPNFVEYLLVRDDGVHPTILTRIPSQQQTAFVDYMPESGVDYDYYITQATIEGLDVLVSEPSHAQARVDLMHVILSDVEDGAENRIGLHFDEDRGIDHIDDLVLEHPWGQRAPTGVYGTAQYQAFGGTFTLIATDQASARDHIEALRNLWESRATICYRDERGRKFFGKIRKFREQDRRVQFYAVELEIVEVGHHEGSHE